MDRLEKKIKNVEQKLVSAETAQFAANIQEYAEMKEDENLLKQIRDQDFVAKGLRYHANCRSLYQSQARAMSKNGNQPRTGYISREKEVHREAFDSLISYIEQNVIEKREVHLLTDLNTYYTATVHEIGGEDFQHATPTAQKLDEKLTKHFGERIVVQKGKTKRGNIVHSSEMSKEEALAFKFDKLMDIKMKIRDAALVLREAIMKAPQKQIPSSPTMQDIIGGEVDVPELVQDFFKYLVGGPDSRIWKQPGKQRRIRAISQDAVFSATSGKKKPGKHLITALAMKSMTGCRKVIEVLNRMGHCASYHTAEEIETELTFSVKNNDNEMPFGMHSGNEYGTGVAWDNFDRFVETMSGKDTLHDTVAIAYQLVEAKASAQKPESGRIHHENITETKTKASLPTIRVGLSKKRRRSYETESSEIQPYHKKPRLENAGLLAADDIRLLTSEENVDLGSWKKDVLWMLDVWQNPNTPMWAGWNAERVYDCRKQMKVWYLPQINQSPTSNAVVVETMKRSQKLAEESNKSCMVVTYDLAIAKIALQIQAQEKPVFDNLFISLGSFHVEKAYFCVIGKLIAESGAPHILNECGALAVGSINGFIKGKHYNRCKRIHELLAVSLEILFFEWFQKSQNNPDIVPVLQNELKCISDSPDINKYQHSKEGNDILERYRDFYEKTLAGDNGKTAQFWCSYISLMHLYHRYSRSVRTGDLEGYTNTLLQMANYFFALNHHNYARWTVKYHDNLLKLKETHPEIYEEFKDGLFSVKRTNKPFSGSPIDLTLEQTINKDAASKRIGIAAMTNSISARQRWAESHFIRTSILSHVFQEAGMHKKEDVTHGLKKHAIRKDNKTVKDIIYMIKETMNPFTEDIDSKHLYNIGTGKTAPEEVESFLLNVREAGEVQRKKFMNECREEPGRFLAKITRQEVSTFATAGTKSKKTDVKRVAACMVRDLFGSILYASVEKRIDLAEVLKYPLTPVPLSLCHVDGTMLKTPKSALMQYLENKVKSNSPEHIDVTIIDASFYFHLLPGAALPTKFGGISSHILRKIMASEGDEIHFVSDKWLSPSIKDCERAARDGSVDSFKITGGNQKRPANWMSALRNAGFKESLVKYLVASWADDCNVKHLGTKTLYANDGDTCYKYVVEGNSVVKSEESRYSNDHEEADARMFFHVHKITGQKNIVIRTNDTDCLVIGLGSQSNFCNHKVWIDAGLVSNNTRRYIDMTKLAANLGESLCSAMPAYHAFTGCDYTAAFSRKGKVRPLKILEKNANFQNSFTALGKEQTISDETFSSIEKFTAEMYGKRKSQFINDIRLELFLERYKPSGKLDEARISCLKKMDGSTLPPCHNVLKQKIKRVHLIANRWNSVDLATQSPISPTESGWTLGYGSYQILWTEGDLYPKTIDVLQNDKDGSDDEDINDCTGMYLLLMNNRNINLFHY